MKKYLYCLLAALLPFVLTQAQPNRIWATYYGNYNFGYGTKITSSVLDPVSGSIYVTGTTSDSTGIATPGSFKPDFHPVFSTTNPNYTREIFLAKFDVDGHRIWATYYGADATPEDRPVIAVDRDGNIYLSGKTSSQTGIATPGSYQPVSNGSYQPFLVKFNSAGQRLWGTYLCTPYANPIDIFSYQAGIAIDAQNNVYLAHCTRDTSGIATPGAHKMTMDNSPFSNPDAFLMKFDPQGVKQWGTYYGGMGWDEINSLYVDGNNNICALGLTQSNTGIASPGAQISTIPQQENYTCFIAKFNNNGQRIWGTYVDGNKGHYPHGIIVEKNSGQNNIYITGHTASDSGIATPDSHQPALGGNSSSEDAFLIKYTAAGTKIWGTYFGGTGNESTEGTMHNTLAFDDEANVYLTGTTNSAHAIKKGCTYDAFYKDGFIAKWTPAGKLMWGSYYDGELYSIAANDKNKTFYVTGSSTHDGLATPGAHQVNKTPLKISGIIAKFEGDYTCPEMNITLTNQNGVLHSPENFVNYQWFSNNGTAVPGATSANFGPTDTGHYYVVIISECDCVYTSDTISFSPVTGIRKMGNKQNVVQLYPNPTTGIFNLVYTASDMPEQPFEYTITDLTGRIIEQGKLHFSQKQTASFNFTYLDNGIYFMRLTGEEGYTDLKFVKTE